MNRKNIYKIIKKLKTDKEKLQNYEHSLIQAYIDTIEDNRLEKIEREFNKTVFQIKRLNKRIVLIKSRLYYE